MPMSMLRLRPGVNSELTLSQNEAGYSTSQFIRFRNGLAEKLGGWDKFYAFAVGGVPKALHAWLDLNENEYLAVGTTTVLGTILDGTLGNITPQQKTTNFAPNFSTVNGSPNVTVDDSNISTITAFDSVQFLTPVAIGGLILSGVYPVALNLGTTTFRIIADSNATATVNNGGAVPVFTTSAGSASVSVLLTAHGLSVGDSINFPIATVLSTTGNDAFTKSLLHFNGADASTTFTDSNAGGSAHTWTANGNAQIDTAQFEFGGASGLFDGTGDYITTPDSSDFTLGTSDFTIDFWLRPNTTGTALFICGQANAAGLANADTAWAFDRSAANKIEFNIVSGTTVTTLTGTTSLSAATWYHVAVVRTSNVLKLFLNGVQEGASVAYSSTVNNSASVLAIGRAGAISTLEWNGWVDEFRFSNGVARWTTTFTPATAEYGTAAVQILGTYNAVSITDANNFVIAINQVAGDAGVFAMNGSLARLLYYIAIGPVSATSGYGIGTYGTGGYGTGATTGQQTGTNISATDWTLDNWGQTLLACPDGDGIYQWTPGTGLANAQLVGTAPPLNTGILVATEIQIAIAFGSTTDLNIGIDQDPLLVRWSNQGDYTDWSLTAAAGTSQAGSHRLSTGSKIVGGLAGPLNNLLWTDVGLWVMSYVGPTDVFGFNPVAYGCGLLGKHAFAKLGSNVYWLSQDNIYVLGGGAPQVVQCPVWDVIFQDMNRDQQHKSWAWANSPFNEVWFFWPRASTNATEPDAYVKVNILENAWDVGVLDRTAGINQSILGMPISATSGSIIYEHEVSRNADGVPMNSFFETGYFQLTEGQDIMMMDWFLPDAKFGESSGAQTATIMLDFDVVYYPGDTPTTYGPYTFTSTTRFINARIRGRLAALRWESNDLDSFWRVGGLRLRGQNDGRL